jgi:hypothetical protein
LRLSSLSTLAAAVAVAALAAAAAPAGANTLSYGGSSDPTDPSLPFTPADTHGATTCATPPNIVDFPPGSHFDLYAFRNASPSSDCITVTGSNPDCATEQTFDDTATIDGGSFLGTDQSICDGNSHAHSFTADAGQTFIEVVFGPGDSLLYGLSVSGADVVPAQVLAAAGSLPDGNTLNVNVSSLEDGTGVEGTLSDSAGTGHNYSGPVRCLSVSGSDASVVMTITSEEGLASKWKGAVYWLHSSADGTSDGQRNSLLTQSQLDGRYASCPDPTAPVGGSFKTIPTTGAVTIVANGPQTAG